MSPFRNSVYRERSHIRSHALKLTTHEIANRKHCDSSQTYEQALEKNYQAILNFYEKNFFGPLETTEDKNLKNWRRWMDERKKTHLYLGWKKERDTEWLVMNSAEDRRTEQEIKTVLGYVENYEPPDPYRGSPSFWKASTLMGARCTCVPHLGGLRQEQPEEDIKNMEFVGVPSYIRRVEKDIAGIDDSANKRTLWARSNYLRERTRNLAPKMNFIDAYFPETNLMVQGVGYRKPLPEEEKPKTPVLRDLPRMVFETVEDVDFELRRRMTNPVTGQMPPLEVHPNEAPPLAKLRVGAVTLWREMVREKKGAPLTPIYMASGPLRWDVDMVARLDENVSAVLRLENLGQVSIGLSWEQLRGPGPGNPVTGGCGLRPQRFYHDKRRAVCPPGQVQDHEVLFHSPEAGVFRETWELRFEPRLLGPGRRFIVTLWGAAGLGEEDEEDAAQEALEELEAEEAERKRKEKPGASASSLFARHPDGTPLLHSGLRRPTARALLRHLDRCVASAAASDVLEEMAGPRLHRIPTPPPYRSLYLEDEVFEHLNPTYYYRTSTVRDLKELFEEVTERPAAEWDLSLHTLKELIRHPGPNVEMETTEKRLAKLQHIMEHLRAPLPVPVGVTRLGTQAAAYGALCGFANAMEREAHQLQQLYGLGPPDISISLTPPHQAHRTRSTSQMHSEQNSQNEADTEAELAEENCRRELYKAALYVRVYHLLGDAIERMVAAIGAPELLRVAPTKTPAPTVALCGPRLPEGEV